MDETNQLPTGTECPQCNKKMRTFMVQSRNPNKNVELDRCHSCGGVWFDAGELELATGRSVKATAKPTNTRYCPRCLIPLLNAEMTGGIAVESCRHCKGTYLDARDIAQCARAQKAQTPPSVTFQCDGCKKAKPFDGAEVTPKGTLCSECMAKGAAVLDAQEKEKTSIFKSFVGWLRGD
ncbi:MAG: zf-TFIIB domain-containing protein [Archangium sp.]